MTGVFVWVINPGEFKDDNKNGLLFYKMIFGVLIADKFYFPSFTKSKSILLKFSLHFEKSLVVDKLDESFVFEDSLKLQSIGFFNWLLFPLSERLLIDSRFFSLLILWVCCWFELDLSFFLYLCIFWVDILFSWFGFIYRCCRKLSKNL